MRACSPIWVEVPTALLPSFLTSTLGAPASALGLIEGIADGCAGVAKFTGGALAAMQSLGNFAASAVVGLVWTTVSPRAAFLYLAVWMVIALFALAFARR